MVRSFCTLVNMLCVLEKNVPCSVSSWSGLYIDVHYVQMIDASSQPTCVPTDLLPAGFFQLWQRHAELFSYNIGFAVSSYSSGHFHALFRGTHIHTCLAVISYIHIKGSRGLSPVLLGMSGMPDNFAWFHVCSLGISIVPSFLVLVCSFFLSPQFIFWLIYVFLIFFSFSKNYDSYFLIYSNNLCPLVCSFRPLMCKVTDKLICNIFVFPLCSCTIFLSFVSSLINALLIK